MYSNKFRDIDKIILVYIRKSQTLLISINKLMEFVTSTMS